MYLTQMKGLGCTALKIDFVFISDFFSPCPLSPRKCQFVLMGRSRHELSGGLGNACAPLRSLA